MHPPTSFCVLALAATVLGAELQPTATHGLMRRTTPGLSGSGTEAHCLGRCGEFFSRAFKSASSGRRARDREAAARDEAAGAETEKVKQLLHNVQKQAYGELFTAESDVKSLRQKNRYFSGGPSSSPRLERARQEIAISLPEKVEEAKALLTSMKHLLHNELGHIAQAPEGAHYGEVQLIGEKIQANAKRIRVLAEEGEDKSMAFSKMLNS